MDISPGMPGSSDWYIRHHSAIMTEQSCVLGTQKKKTQESKVSKSLDDKFGVSQVLLQTTGLCAKMPSNETIIWAHTSDNNYTNRNDRFLSADFVPCTTLSTCTL